MVPVFYTSRPHWEQRPGLCVEGPSKIPSEETGSFPIASSKDPSLLLMGPGGGQLWCVMAKSEITDVHWTHLSPCSSIPPAPLQLLLSLEREAQGYEPSTQRGFLPLVRGAQWRGRDGLSAADTPSDFSVGTSRTNSKAKRRGRENTQTSWNNICRVNV